VTQPLRHLQVAALLWLGVTATCAAQAYRYKDRDGHWVYTDRPPADAAAQSVEVRATAGSPRIAVEPRSTPRGVDMVAVNECRCPVEFGLKVAMAGSEKTARKVLEPKSEALLLAMPAGGGDNLTYQFVYVIGDPKAEHAPPQPYRAPFALAESFTVTQAAPDAITHVDAGSRNAVDIGMPVGTPVHAAREGLVINVAYSFYRGGTNLENREEANFVQVLHDDGTTAIYAHLQMDTIRVRPGQRIARGETIANSGNTGFTSGPHLHFAVLRNAGLRSESVPVTFAGPGGVSVRPQSGKALTAY
jgi:hypothetical protein